MLPLIIGLAGPDLSPDERAFIAEAQPAGFTLFARNVVDPEQLRRLTQALRVAQPEALILIDQEGGRVARLGPPHWPDFPAGAVFDRLYQLAPISALEAARVNGAAIGTVLATAGITMCTAPVLDLAWPETPVPGDRGLGRDPRQVAALGRAMLEGLSQAGVAGVIKHMPGQGRAGVDSHDALPVVTASAAELEEDLLPFQRLAGAATAGMTAHVVYKAWDAQAPATLSRRVIGDVIRGRIGFDGLLMSDDIGMGALRGTLPERALAALEAGCDLVLHCSGELVEAEAIAGEVSRLADAALERMKRAVPVAAEAMPPLSELIAKRDALLGLVE